MAIEFYSSIDLNQNELQNAVIQNAGSDPSGGVEGQIYYNSTDNQLKVHDGSNFVNMSGDITGITAGVGLSGGGSSGAVTLTLDMSELTDMTASINSSEDELILLDNGADRRKLISEIPLSAFNNDSGFTTNTGDITAVVAGAGLTDGGSTGSVTVNAGAGTGITVNSDDIAVTATQTGITSILNTSLEIGRDADNKIRFATDDDIIFRVAGANQLSFVDGAIKPTTDNDIDLGTSSRQFKNGFFHGTLETDAITINGSSLSDTVETLVSGFTAASAEAVTVTDSTANTNFPVVFNNEAGGLLDDTGTFIYNPSTGTLSVTNIIVSGDTTTANETVKIVENNTLEFEGAAGTNAAHELKLTTAQLTGDKTITLPDATGTVALTSNLHAVVTLAGKDYLSISGQEITANQIDLTDDVTGVLPVANTAAKVTSIVAGAGIDVNNSGVGDVTVTAETASATNAGIVELATAAEVITGTDTSRAVTPDTLAARLVVADIDVSSLTDDLRATITHNLGTADLMVQLYDKTTEATVYADIGRTTDDFSTASTSVITVDFGTVPPNDIRCVITSLAGATAGSVAYT